MKNLEFSGKYLDMLRSGQKRGTVRLGKLKIEPGTVVTIHSGGYVVGKAIIIGVDYKKVRELTEEDAKEDGFKSLQELLNALKAHYPSLSEDDDVTVIRFDIVEKPDKPVMSSEYPYDGHDPFEIATMALKNLKLDEEDRKVLEVFLEEGSIRRTAKRLGSVKMRNYVREVIRRAYRELKEKNLI